MHKQQAPCPVCRAPAPLLGRLEHGQVFHCHACGHEFSILPEGAGEPYAEDYFQVEHANWFAHPDLKLYTRLADVLQRQVGSRARLLDVGCGTGNFLKFLQVRGFSDLHGVDLMPVDIPGVRCVLSRVEDYAPQEPFDAVVSLANIEHIPDVYAHIRSMHAFLRPGGLLVVYTVDNASLLYRLAKAVWSLGVVFPAWRLYAPHHLNHFSVCSLERLARDAGFEILQRWKAPMPLKSVDVGSGAKRVVLLSAILAINTAAAALDSDMLQVAVCRKLP